MISIDQSEYDDIYEIFSTEDNELLLRIINPISGFMNGETIVIKDGIYLIVDTVQYPLEAKTVYFIEKMCEC